MTAHRHTHFPIDVVRDRTAFSSVIPSSPDRGTHVDVTHEETAAGIPGTKDKRNLEGIFHSLSGDWHVHRAIYHRGSKKGIDGDFDGTATFLPRAPSTEAPEPGTQEYLYREHGTFTTATGASFPAQMKYVYQYHPASNRISVWRVKPGSSSAAAHEGEVESWFHDITLESLSGAEGMAWFAEHQSIRDCVAKGSEHLCVKDTYRPYYRFCFKEDGLAEFGIGYEVSGPEKDYVSEAWFERTVE